MQVRIHQPLGAVCAAVVLSLASSAASAVAIANVNGSAAPQNFIFGVDDAGWMWTATQSFDWTGLDSTFFGGASNALSPSQATLTIATGTPASGGTTLFSGAVDGSGHSSFSGISVTAGTSYFIGYSGLLGPSGTAVGLNIATWLPAQAPGTVNLDGWYTGAGFGTFHSQMEGGTLQVFSAPILNFEGDVLTPPPPPPPPPPPVPEPGTYALLLGGLAIMGAALRKRSVKGVN